MNDYVNDYGPFAELVRNAGFLLAVVAALALGWRGRTKWEPSEQDIPRGPQKVASLASAVAISAIWASFRNPDQLLLVRNLALILAGLTIVALCMYGYITAVFTYHKETIATDGVRRENVIAGFSLTKEATRALAEQTGLTVQELYKGAAYDQDRVWTRHSRAAAKTLFILSYLLLMICGTLALASAAVLVSLTPP